MLQIVEGTTHDLTDVKEFLDLLRAHVRTPETLPQLLSLFDSERDIVVTRAPGRLDVMGGIADYSGSLVLEMPISEATFVAVQVAPERTLRIASLIDAGEKVLDFEVDLSIFDRGSVPLDYDSARSFFRQKPEDSWAAYVAGVFLVLMRERGVRFEQGARMLVASRVPEGKGVSSSAALEVATMQAVAAAFGIDLEPRDIALLCQKVENLVVGAPCGIMDQMTCVRGEADELLMLLCQPADVLGSIAVPDDIAFWGIDSGVRHAVSGSDYTSVRVGAFMGYRIIADLAGLDVRSESSDQVEVDDPRWNGFLANVSPWEFEDDFARLLPDSMSGAEFLSRYRGTTDSVTRVDPARTYAVRIPAAHAIYENSRVRRFLKLLKEPGSDSRSRSLGTLMYESHASYSACGLGEARTDLLVELVRRSGAGNGLFGAKITGGGSGGTVAVLGRRDAHVAIARITQDYAAATGHRPHVFAGSSPGSARFGHLKLRIN